MDTKTILGCCFIGTLVAACGGAPSDPVSPGEQVEIQGELAEEEGDRQEDILEEQADVADEQGDAAEDIADEQADVVDAQHDE